MTAARRGWAAAAVALGVTAAGVVAGAWGRMRIRARAAMARPLSKHDSDAITRMEGEGGPAHHPPQAATAAVTGELPIVTSR